MFRQQRRGATQSYRNEYYALLAFIFLCPLFLTGALFQPTPTPTAGSGDLLSEIPVVDENTLNSVACGIAAATMILDYYVPQSGPIQQAIDITAVSQYVKQFYGNNAKTGKLEPQGSSLNQLETGVEEASTAPALNFGVPLEASWHTTDNEHWSSVLQSELDAKRPILLFIPNGHSLGWSWNYGHFIVVSGYTNDKSIIYHDPWGGRQHTLSHDDFTTAWGTAWNENLAWQYMTVSPNRPQTIDGALHSKTNPYPPYKGQLVLDDPLDHDTGQWKSDSRPDFCVFKDGKYVLTAMKHSGGGATCSGLQKITGDFTFQVETTFVYQSYVSPNPKDDGEAGIAFSRDNGGRSYFYYYIDQQGALSLYFEGQRSPALDFVTKQIPGFKKDQPNLLAVVVIGEQVTVYFNLVKEFTVTVPHLGQGHIVLDVEFGAYSYFPSAAFQYAKLWM